MGESGCETVASRSQSKFWNCKFTLTFNCSWCLLAKPFKFPISLLTPSLNTSISIDLISLQSQSSMNFASNNYVKSPAWENATWMTQIQTFSSNILGHFHPRPRSPNFSLKSPSSRRKIAAEKSHLLESRLSRRREKTALEWGEASSVLVSLAWLR
jgi:hypothetical protein